MIFLKSTILKFGKYKKEGKTLEEIMNEDAAYLVWCEKNISWFEVPQELLEEIAYTAELQYEDSLPYGLDSDIPDSLEGGWLYYDFHHCD